MNINGIGNSAASWAQFVKLTQAARERNNGLTAESVAFRRVTDVYSSTVNKSAQSVQSSMSTQNAPPSHKPVGGQFDAYA